VVAQKFTCGLFEAILFLESSRFDGAFTPSREFTFESETRSPAITNQKKGRLVGVFGFLRAELLLTLLIDEATFTRININKQ
jgi:hypothetical protein